MTEIEELKNKIKELDNTIEDLQEENFRLCRRDDFLTCLEETGVDNWEGYDIAQDKFDEYYDE